MENKPTVTLMCGLPRSGKSTWIRKNKTNEIIVSPDEIRAKIFGHQFHREAEGFIWAFAESMAKLLLEQGQNVIIDATNINYQSRDKWIRIAKQYDAEIKVIFFKTSLKVCKKRNEKSKAGQKVPEQVIDNMAMCFEEPIYSTDEKIEIVCVFGRESEGRRYSSKECLIAKNCYVDEILKRKV